MVPYNESNPQKPNKLSKLLDHDKEQRKRQRNRNKYICPKVLNTKSFTHTLKLWKFFQSAYCLDHAQPAFISTLSFVCWNSISSTTLALADCL